MTTTRAPRLFPLRRVRRALAVLVTAAATSSAAVAVAPAAHAAGSQLLVRDGVIYDGCFKHSFDYAVDPAKAGLDWAVEVRVLDARGVQATAAYVWKSDGAPAAGTATGEDGLQFCDLFEQPGTYRAEGKVTYFSGSVPDDVLAPVVFTMRPAGAAASLKVDDATARVGQRLTFTTRITGEYPTGYFPIAYAPTVVLQKKVGSSWRNLARGSADQQGVVRFKVRWKDARVRAVRVLVKPDTPYVATVSRTIKVR